MGGVRHKRSVVSRDIPLRPTSVGVGYEYPYYLDASIMAEVDPLVTPDMAGHVQDRILGARVVGDDGVVLGYGAVVPYSPVFPHICEALFYPTDRSILHKYVPELYGAVRNCLIEAARRQRYTRIQAHIKDNHTLRSWGERLGFTIEGVLRGFAPNGEDRAIMSLLLKDVTHGN